MAVSALAAAATQTSTLGIFTLFDLSHERLLPSATSASASSRSLPLPHHNQESFVINRTFCSTFLSPENSSSSRPNSDRSSYSSSPRQYPTELTDPILEEGDETDSEVANEPVTPVSGRQSQDFQTLANHEVHPDVAQVQADQSVPSFPAVRAGTTPGSKPPLVLNTEAGSPPRAPPRSSSSSVIISNSQQTPRAAEPATPTTAGTSLADQDPAAHPPARRPTFSGSTIRRNMSSFIKRVTHSDRTSSPSDSSSTVGYSEHPVHENGRQLPARRWSMNRSSATTRSNTPPSPGSPVEMAIRSKEQASTPTVPGSDEFIKKKPRASTNFLRSRPHVPKKIELQLRRRASSFDYTNQQKSLVASTPDGPVDIEKIERQIWEMPAETGTGLKARRMSLSLPDDFVVDVAELQSEFEYEHKLLGRHGKSFGKGGHGKVRTMARKGCPTELFAVKEFRSKSRSETKEDYEKKIKSEYTLSKSLNHPNVVATIRLCIDHGRWNHVMEFCSEGDLYGLVKEGYLKGEDKEKDRLCLFKQLARGVHYLHSNGIAHRDIKLENLLITSDSALKIADFGVSEVFCGSHPGLRESGGQCGKNMGEIRRCAPGICGSMPYMAPEVLKKEGDYDPRGVDVWSSAVVMLHLIFGGAIWSKAESGDKNYDALVNGWRRWNEAHKDVDEPTITEMDYPKVKAFDFAVRPPALRRVLLQMLNPDPDRRTSIHDVVNNRWVKNIECCQKADNEEPDPATTMIDASKKGCLIRGGQKLFCHNHLPPKKQFSSHSLGKMPGSVGY
ncbi:kinase-like domain-containing protein [Triangularia verruculosa]|uniref:Kinase-like domain-containing protein n=1 Tax=Triangularia verruculosa TaxID=2587418 RepID=A0AAN7APV9_9PEZI|nr:kinase-like domain-containing protein [Triangularia verruculosa]